MVALVTTLLDGVAVSVTNNSDRLPCKLTLELIRHTFQRILGRSLQRGATARKEKITFNVGRDHAARFKLRSHTCKTTEGVKPTFNWSGCGGSQLLFQISAH